MKSSLLFVFLLPCTASCSQPEGRWQSAVVSQQGELPCFGIPDRSDVRAKPLDMRFVSVGQQGDGDSGDGWELNFTGQSPPVLLLPTACFRYGANLGQDVGATAPALVPGRLYEVSMMGDVLDDPISTSRNYDAWFCLARSRDGRLTVHQVAHEKREHFEEVCPP